jgi:tetratricopeptide (TPR) repeat protein
MFKTMAIFAALAWASAAWAVGVTPGLAQAPASSVTDPAPTPTDAAGFARRGARALMAGDYTAALADYGQAERLEPKAAKHAYNHGVAEYALGRLDLALADFDQAILLEPSDLFPLMGRGRVELMQGQAARARRDFAEVLRLSNNDPKLTDQMAQAYEKAHAFEDEVRMVDLIALNANDANQRATLLDRRCFARAQWGRQLDNALADCDAAVALAPNTAYILDSRGLVKLRMGRLADAVIDYNAALRLSPKLASSLYGRGVAYRRAGRPSDGATDITAAKALDPNVESDFAAYGVRP